MLIQICKLSLAALENTHNSGLLQQLLNEVYRVDILIQLNAIEMLSDLTMVDHGLIYLDQQGIVGKLESMMEDLESNPYGNLLLPGLKNMKIKQLFRNMKERELFYQQLLKYKFKMEQNEIFICYIKSPTKMIAVTRQIVTEIENWQVRKGTEYNYIWKSKRISLCLL